MLPAPLHVPLQYDGVLENVSQETVYTCCGHEVVEGVLAGYNGTLMCYGQVSLESSMLRQCTLLVLEEPRAGPMIGSMGLKSTTHTARI